MKHWRSVRTIIDEHTLISVGLALLSTWICLELELFAEFPLTMIGTAVVFPIVFSIGGAYKRREGALTHYGVIKAHGHALFLASRDWIDDSDTELQSEAAHLLYELLDACRTMFSSPIDEMAIHERRVDQAFSNLSLYVRKLRSRGLPSGEASRLNQFVSKMIVAFESVKHVYQYRTPITLRTYSKVFIYILPVLYGPYFAAISQDYSRSLTFVMPVLLSVILVSLDNIQEHLENPFDQVGEDDVMINAEKFLGRLLLVDTAGRHPR